MLAGIEPAMTSIGDRVTEPGAAFLLRGGELAVWVDGGIQIKAVNKDGDSVELTAEDARGLIRALEHLLLLIE